MKITRRQLRRLISEAADAHAIIVKLMSDGEVNQALSLASSLGIPLETLPWDVPDEVLAKGMKAVLAHMMVRRTGSTEYFMKVFDTVFAIAKELGIATQDLPWDIDSVTDYLDPYKTALVNHQFKATYKGVGKLIPRDQIDVMINKHLEPTGWTIDDWERESAKADDEFWAQSGKGRHRGIKK